MNTTSLRTRTTPPSRKSVRCQGSLTTAHDGLRLLIELTYWRRQVTLASVSPASPCHGVKLVGNSRGEKENFLCQECRTVLPPQIGEVYTPQALTLRDQAPGVAHDRAPDRALAEEKLDRWLEWFTAASSLERLIEVPVLYESLLALIERFELYAPPSQRLLFTFSADAYVYPAQRQATEGAISTMEDVFQRMGGEA